LKPEHLNSWHLGSKALILASALLVGLLATAHHLRKPIRDAKKIQQGDGVDRVHRLLGSPTTVFETDAELRRSELEPMSFVFTDTGNNLSDVPVAELPVVTGRAEWFEYTPTAGHLVFFKDDHVEIVFWGGT
jgi:hypothetical protein